MSTRVSLCDVRCVKKSDATDEMLGCIIDSANAMVDVAASRCPSLTDAQLKQAELYLSAHFLSIQNPEQTKFKFENAEISYARGSQNGEGVTSTQWGQMANTFTNGCLKSMEMPQAQVVVL